jgi:hypothetical protein
MLTKELSFTIGQAIFYASISASFASVLMSSTFSVKNFSKDQETLNGAADALRHYIIMGSIWAIATMFVLYSQEGMCGLWLGLAANAVIMGWIFVLYHNAFNDCVRKYGLEYPKIF